MGAPRTGRARARAGVQLVLRAAAARIAARGAGVRQQIGRRESARGRVPQPWRAAAAPHARAVRERSGRRACAALTAGRSIMRTGDRRALSCFPKPSQNRRDREISQNRCLRSVPKRYDSRRNAAHFGEMGELSPKYAKRAGYSPRILWHFAYMAFPAHTRPPPPAPAPPACLRPPGRGRLALVHHTPLTLGGLDMTHACLIHVVRALEGHETELGALTDATRRRDFN